MLDNTLNAIEICTVCGKAFKPQHELLTECDTCIAEYLETPGWDDVFEDHEQEMYLWDYLDLEESDFMEALRDWLDEGV